MLCERPGRLQLAATLAHMSLRFGKVNPIALPQRMDAAGRELVFYSSNFLVCQNAAKELTSSRQTSTVQLVYSRRWNLTSHSN